MMFGYLHQCDKCLGAGFVYLLTFEEIKKLGLKIENKRQYRCEQCSGYGYL